MIVKDYISYDCPIARPEDLPADILDLMNDFKIKQIPYVVDGKYVVLLDEMQIDELDFQMPIKEQIKGNFIAPFCYENQHLLEVLPMFGHNYLTLLPVITEEQKFTGVLLSEDILSAIGTSLSPKREGAIIVLDVAMFDYSLSQIAQIVESNDAKTLQLFVSETANPDRLEVIIKINQPNVARILQTFYRYDYVVKNVFAALDNLDDLSDRYKSFMRLLDI
ncbi:MAG: CBS domain-containing protein [Bacteroidales bacterium]|jgi:CBS domain-containing protein|nr:CBS domain-containing protein [Bacteroidales bacterium]